MKAFFRISILFFFVGLFTTPTFAQAQTCSQTLSPGANVASAVSSASNGTVICLNSGSYGNVDFTNIRRSDFVTLRSASGQGARMSIGAVYNSSFIRFDSLTFDSVAVRECSSDLQFTNSTWTSGGGGLGFIYTTACSQSDMRLVVDGATFASVGRAGYEGRLSVRGVRGLTIKNSVFSGQPSNAADASDGVMLVGGSTNVTIGPGNVFRDIIQSQCGSVHCDAIQMYGNGSGTVITGNYFVNNTIHIGNYDGGSPNSKITNNIFIGGQSGQNLQIGGIQGMLVEHNTFRNAVMAVGTKAGDSPNSGWTIQNNIFDNAALIASGDQPGCGSGCVVHNNLKSNGGSTNPAGTNSIAGTVVYAGSGSLTNWAGWQLAAGSPGKAAATDGKDVGVVLGTSGSQPDTTPPPAPTNLTVQ